MNIQTRTQAQQPVPHYETKAFVYCPICTHTVEGIVVGHRKDGQGETRSKMLAVLGGSRSGLHHAAGPGSITPEQWIDPEHWIEETWYCSLQ